MAKCDICGTKVHFLDTRCTDCMEKRNQEILAKRNKPDESEARQEAEQATLDLTVTTAQSIENQRVTKTIDIVTAECVFGMNIFRDLFAGMSDFFGGRNKSSQKVLRDARVTCLNELRKEAVAIGGNAVIAVDLDYSEFSGGGKSMLFLVASGTAVVIEPLESVVE
ncbi:YbjQ family protein [Onishia niordana]|uniref:YbjQ family protein n=1 Tax=Onishia niordana TaxID=2508711 RepID=UPI0010A04D7B|nr:YbjQ family protein [Halomonas niordiana]